jgi:hypothetical protein
MFYRFRGDQQRKQGLQRHVPEGGSELWDSKLRLEQFCWQGESNAQCFLS